MQLAFLREDEVVANGMAVLVEWHRRFLPRRRAGLELVGFAFSGCGRLVVLRGVGGSSAHVDAFIRFELRGGRFAVCRFRDAGRRCRHLLVPTQDAEGSARDCQTSDARPKRKPELLPCSRLRVMKSFIDFLTTC